MSPALGFGGHAPSASLGRYQLGDEVAVDPVTGGVISAADYALGFVDLIDKDALHRAHVNLANPGEIEPAPTDVELVREGFSPPVP